MTWPRVRISNSQRVVAKKGILHGADTYDKTCDDITYGINTKTKMLASHVGVQIGHGIYVVLLTKVCIDTSVTKT